MSEDYTYELSGREVRGKQLNPETGEPAAQPSSQFQVRIKLKKKESDWWPRLLYEQKKLPWLRVDFDR